MPTVGQQLRAAREAQKLTIQQVAEQTHIRGDHISAIDQGNYKVFAAPVYIRGFVRTYAMAVHLDPKPLLELLNQELAASGPMEPSFAPPAPDKADSVMFHLSRIHWKKALAAAGALVLVGSALWGYRTWQSRRQRDPLAGLSAGLYQPAPGSRQTLPLPPLRR
jgi:cytoskeletal protein RodZ